MLRSPFRSTLCSSEIRRWSDEHGADRRDDGAGGDSRTDGKQATEKKSPVRPRRHRRSSTSPWPSAPRGGKRRARRCPAEVLGEWGPKPHRPDPVELLEDQAKARVPELVPIRYGRMLVSPFTFFRGAAYLMASDLAGGPRTGLHTQLCGDAHLSNFGVFAAPDRRLVFAINDFDETLPGPFEWDLKRLVASFAVAGRDRGFDDRTRSKINTTVGRHYREAMRGFARDAQSRRLVRTHRHRGRCSSRVLRLRNGRSSGSGWRRTSRRRGRRTA